jgi:hypothetical protein
VDERGRSNSKERIPLLLRPPYGSPLDGPLPLDKILQNDIRPTTYAQSRLLEARLCGRQLRGPQPNSGSHQNGVLKVARSANPPTARSKREPVSAADSHGTSAIGGHDHPPVKSSRGVGRQTRPELWGSRAIWLMRSNLGRAPVVVRCDHQAVVCGTVDCPDAQGTGHAGVAHLRAGITCSPNSRIVSRDHAWSIPGQ